MERFESDIDQAIGYLLTGGTTDGAHHKQWYIDQALRCLAKDSYQARVIDWTYGSASWDVGTPA